MTALHSLDEHSNSVLIFPWALQFSKCLVLIIYKEIQTYPFPYKGVLNSYLCTRMSTLIFFWLLLILTLGIYALPLPQEIWCNWMWAGFSPEFKCVHYMKGANYFIIRIFYVISHSTTIGSILAMLIVELWSAGYGCP